MQIAIKIVKTTVKAKQKIALSIPRPVASRSVPAEIYNETA